MRIAYRADIDGLRAIAVLAVVGFHAFPQFISGGFVGVDVFFVISGYLITSILKSELAEGSWSISAFYARRILRIFPALLLVFSACFFVGWYTLLAGEYKQLGKHLAAGATFLSNFVLWFEAGYFDKASEAKPLLHLWSLGIEEQFYIVFPLVLWCLVRCRRFTWLTVLALAIASLAGSTWLVFVDQNQAFYSPLSRAWELLAGVLLALSPAPLRPAWRKTIVDAMGIVAGSVLLTSFFLMRESQLFPGFFVLPPVLATMVLIRVSDSSWLNQRILSARAMVAIGKISYPLYLWHWPLFSFAYIVESGRPSQGVLILLILASFVLAGLTYKLVEQPIRRLPRKVCVSVLIAGVALFGLLGKNIDQRDGLERIRHKHLVSLTTQAEEDFIDFEKRGLITEARCLEPFKFPERDVCLVAHADRPVTAVVLGDSHAVHSFWGLAQAFERTNDNLKVLGKGACVPFLGFKQGGDANHCQPHIDSTIHAIINNSSIKNVALVFRGRYINVHSSAQELQLFSSSLDATLAQLTLANKTVYYFMPVVELGFDPRLCAGSLPLGRRAPFACEINQIRDNEKSKTVRENAMNVLRRYPLVRVIDPNIAFCHDGVCPILQDGHSVFKDDNHVSYFGSIRIGDAIELH